MILREEQIRRYKAISRIAAERYCTQKHTASSVIISIRSTWDKEIPKVFATKQNGVKDILFLQADDTDQEDDDDKIYSLSKTQGRQIADFVNRYYGQVDRIIAHCNAGRCRSAGVIAAIMRVKEGNDNVVFRNKHPNMTCYLMTLKGFGYI